MQLVVLHVSFLAVVMIRWEAKMIIEPDFKRSDLDFTDTVSHLRFTESSMPLANVRGAISLLFQELRRIQHFHVDGQLSSVNGRQGISA